MRLCTGSLLFVGLLAGCNSATAPATVGDRSSFDAPTTTAGSVVAVRLTFHEPINPPLHHGGCPVSDHGFCGAGEVIPLGNATETIQFGAGCGGACDLRTIYLPQGTLVLEEVFSDFACPGSCHPNRAEPASGSLTDTIVSGTGLFAGATGTLSGRVSAAGGESVAKLSGSITLAT